MTASEPKRWARATAFVSVGLLALWLMLVVAMFLIVVLRGNPALYADLRLASQIVFGAALLLGITVYVLRSTGVMPGPTPEEAKAMQDAREARPRRYLVNIAIWVFVALMLVFVFNFIQGAPH